MRIFFAIGLVVSCSLFTINSHAQDKLSKANNLATSGKFAEAIQVYSEILSTNANNTAVRLGRGYTYSWNHEWAKATSDFTNILQKYPSNIDAQKGLAYVELWSGKDKKAIGSFSSLIEKQPGNKELYIALGMAQINEGLLGDARKSFDKAKQLNPGDQEPEQLINTIRTQPTKLDIDLLGGISTADGETKGGLRFVQLSSQVSKKVNLSVKYDNSLSLDNLGLITSKRTIPYYAGAIQYKWSRQLITKLEGGYRNFTDAKVGEGAGERQLTLEQIFFLKKGKSLKIGGAFIAPNAGPDAYLLLASYHQPVSKKITAGINYFYAKRNVFNTTENRFLADADFYLPKGNTINAGFYYGKSNSDVKTLSGNIYGGFIKSYFPVSNSIGIHLGVSAEKNFVQNLFNVNAGFRFRLEK
jgi:tetratricopeptide (TPR) repeat protein